MDELLAAHKDVMANRVPEIVQFGSGPLSVIDPTQAPPGKHTTYAWHVMPLNPDIGAKDYETFKQEFAERIIEKWAKYAPNMTRKNIIAQHVYTAREYTQHFPEMRNGDIFMGAFNAEQVMYNHFGYRTPVERLYMAGSATHPGRRDLRRRRLYQRRHHRARSRAEAVVEAVGRRRGAGLDLAGGGVAAVGAAARSADWRNARADRHIASRGQQFCDKPGPRAGELDNTRSMMTRDPL